MRGLKKIAQVAAHTRQIYDLSVAPSGRNICSVGRDGYVKVWRLVKEESESPQLELIHSTEQKHARVLSCLSDQRMIVGMSTGKLLIIANWQEAEQKTKQATEQNPEGVSGD